MNIKFERISSNIKLRGYPLIGSGSGRTVFDLKNGYVVKAAKNKKGIEQNKAECEISKKDHHKIFAEVIAYSDDYRFLIMEKAQRINSFAIVWKYYNVKNNKQLLSLEEISHVLEEYDLLPVDLYRLSSWGIVNGKPVIIDYGFTRQVRELYRFRL